MKLEKPDLAVEYVPVTSNTRFTSLVDNKIDILCGSTTKTLSRSELVDFSQLTFVTGASLLSLRDKPVSNISDLQGKKVAVVKDTTTIDILKATLKETLTEAEVIEMKSCLSWLSRIIGDPPGGTCRKPSMLKSPTCRWSEARVNWT